MAGSRDRRGLQPVENRRYDRLSQVSPSAFEQLIPDHYRTLGYSVERVGRGGTHFDGGIDLKTATRQRVRRAMQARDLGKTRLP